MTIIRPTRTIDWFDIADIAEEAHAESPIVGPFDRETYVKNWQDFCQQESAVAYSMVVDEVVRGFIVGVVSMDLANGQIVAAMAAWRIIRAYRGRDGIKMLRLWIDRVREMGAVRLTMNHLLDLHSEKFEKFYLRMGMRPLEKHYIMEL